MSDLTILGQPHEADGSGYYRFYLPFHHLSRATGHRVMLPEPGVKFTPTVEQLIGVDVVVGQRFCGPNGIGQWQAWRGHTRLVYEIDDDMLHPDAANGLPHLHDPLVRDSFKVCIAASDLVTVSTEPLAEVMLRYNPNVRIIPNFIDGDLLYTDRVRNDRVTVGWAGGQSHLRDWAVHADPIAVALRGNDVDVHFVGIDYSPLLKLEGRYTPWHPDVWTYFKSIDFDIGLCPLADTQFNRCKSHLKALEYMALGIPVVASNQPAYRDLVIDGVTGYLVSTPDEWRSRLIDLINDEAMRTEMGAKGREVAANWTIQQGWKLWRDAYLDVVDRTVLPKTQPVKVTAPSPETKANIAEWKHLFEDTPTDRAFYQGRELLQFASDLTRYVDLINEIEPPFVIEIGRADAGTALFLADLLGEGQQLISLDVMGPQPDHDRIVYIEGSSTSPVVLDQVRQLADGRRGLVLIDGDHTGGQVAAELAVYADLADYLIVEDTIVGDLGWPDGPHTALATWLPDHPEFTVDTDPAPTQHPGGWLRRT